MFQFALVSYVNQKKQICCCASGFLLMPTWWTCTPKMCHHICIIVIDAPSCMMKMMTTRNAINIFTRYWTFPTSQSPIVQWIWLNSALPIPTGEYNGELGGLVQETPKNYYKCSVGEEPNQSVTQVIHKSKWRKIKPKSDTPSSNL